MVTAEDGGYVLVTKGEHKGKVGYFDDDDVDCSCFEDDVDYTDEEIEEIAEKCRCPGLAIVYFGAPFLSNYYLIPYDCLELTDASHFETIKFIKENPEAAKQMGLCVDVSKHIK